MTYDAKYNALYMIGFMRGHVYCFDVASRRVTKDLPSGLSRSLKTSVA